VTDRKPSELAKQLIAAIDQERGKSWRKCLLASRVVGLYKPGLTLAIARKRGLSVDQIETWARAGRTLYALRRLMGDAEQYHYFKQVITILGPTHLAILGRYWENAQGRYRQMGDEDAVTVILEAAMGGWSKERLAAQLQESFGSREGDPPEWLVYGDRIRKPLYKLTTSYGVPDELREAGKQMLKALDMTKAKEVENDE